MRRHYEWGGRSYEIAIEQLGGGRFILRQGEEKTELTARQQADGSWLIQDGRVTVRVFAHADGDDRWVWLAGRSHSLRRIERRRTQHSLSSVDSGPLRAEMPCQIVKIMVEAGEEVGKGETLLLMEAMKMELRLNAPAAGRVREWLVAEGQVVARGGELLQFEVAGG